jgi:hypothetical protein
MKESYRAKYIKFQENNIFFFDGLHSLACSDFVGLLGRRFAYLKAPATDMYKLTLFVT